MLFLDFLLLFMIGVCVTFCWILNRRIQDLQNSRIEFARMIKELNASITKAEHNVNEMSELSKVTSKEIRETVAEARAISEELVKVSDYAEGVAENLARSASEISTEVHEQDYMAQISSKAGEKFTDDDLPELEEAEGPKYTNHLKSFIEKVVTKKSDSANNMTQSGYYNSLRKVSVRK